jgi:hypothetical protein
MGKSLSGCQYHLNRFHIALSRLIQLYRGHMSEHTTESLPFSPETSPVFPWLTSPIILSNQGMKGCVSRESGFSA